MGDLEPSSVRTAFSRVPIFSLETIYMLTSRQTFRPSCKAAHGSGENNVESGKREKRERERERARERTERNKQTEVDTYLKIFMVTIYMCLHTYMYNVYTLFL